MREKITKPSYRPLKLKARNFDLIVIGSSTGAPSVIESIFTQLPADIPVPIVIAQHMPPKFTKQFAERLENISPLTFFHAEEGHPLLPGTVTIGEGRKHIMIKKGFAGRYMRVHLTSIPEENPYKPSVDVLFDSAAAACGKRVLGIMLTGMGHDGRDGSIKLFEKGATLISQSEKSCVVYGMPKSIAEQQIVEAQLDPDQIRETIYSLSPHYGMDPSKPKFQF